MGRIVPVPSARNRHLSRKALAGLACGAAVLAGCGGGHQAAPSPSTTTAPSVTTPSTAKAGPAATSDSTAGTTPAPSTTTTTIGKPVASPLTPLSKYLINKKVTVSVALYDRVTRQTWLLNPSARQQAGAVTKLALLADILGHHQKEALPKDVRDLLPAMIKSGANPATTTIWDRVGSSSGLAAFDRSLGLDQTAPSSATLTPGTSLPGWEATTTSALDQVRLMEDFAYPNPHLDAASRAYGVSVLEQGEHNMGWGVSGGVPPRGVKAVVRDGLFDVAQHGWQVNSVGWVQGDGRDYVLAVLASGEPTAFAGVSTVEAISTVVYASLGPS